MAKHARSSTLPSHRRLPLGNPITCQGGFVADEHPSHGHGTPQNREDSAPQLRWIRVVTAASSEVSFLRSRISDGSKASRTLFLLVGRCESRRISSCR